MFATLASAVEEVEVPADGDAIAAALGLLDRLAAKVSAAIGAFDAQGTWALDGATSATAWLRHRAGLTSAAAASAVRMASRLHDLPVTRNAWLEGRLSGGQAQAVVANVDDRTAPLFAAHEATLVPALAPLSVSETARAMQAWRARADAVVDEAEPGAGPARSVHFSRTLGGRFVLDGELDVEGGALVATALRLATSADAEGEPPRTPAQRRGDALVDICRFFLDHQRHQRGGRHRPHLNVVVEWETLQAGGPGRVIGGGYIDGATVQRLLCDAAVHRLVTDGRSTILDYGTTTRTVPAPLWSALVLRDEHCRHAGCDRPPEWCEAHHVVPVMEGGPTSLDNLVLKCSRHHHLGHQPGWREELLPGGVLATTDPTGRTSVTHPPGPHDPLRALPGVAPPPTEQDAGAAAGEVRPGVRWAGRRPGPRRRRHGTGRPAPRSALAGGVAW